MELSQWERPELEDRIRATAVEIAALRNPWATEDRLVTAGLELQAIVRTTEEATQTLLGASEAIQGELDGLMASADPETAAAAGRILDSLMSIFEASTFQDITGQRIAKVVKTLQFVEARVHTMVETWGADSFLDLPTPYEAPGDEEAKLLNGPQLGQTGVSQADIDALFD
ncbi:MAG TPA: protein phosphatase CheZ [Alphaproteobacteria bacterium]|nr:protein phosphatase CheZ [Alphaproteobacteria bacterium]